MEIGEWVAGGGMRPGVASVAVTTGCRKGAGVSVTEGIGPLPSSGIISAVFTRAAEFDRAAAAEFGCGLLEPLAGLVVAHRRIAAARPAWGDVVLSADPANRVAVLAETSPGADAFTCAWDSIQRHMLSVDLEARRILAPPPRGAVPHHEGLGAVFCRMAHLYTISHDRFVLDGPRGRNRQQLARAFAAYETLARDLVAGRTRLPALCDRPA